MKAFFQLCALAGVALLAACASSPKLSDAQKLALYQANAGAPVKDFTYLGNLTGWQPIGDSALAVWTKPKEAYLLDLGGPCRDLDYAPAINITNMMGRVSTLDRVRVLGGSGGVGRVSCRIVSIRPLDVSKLKAAEAELRKADVEARQEESAAPAN
ncbi:DUF6491 family protein [Pseudoxanthomonas indica]|uniref:Lipoprotein n=1 Tax=Pseudoxanthomonas indica TaxID=428993 RepID=A0A1T5JB91_9GAMM|nr:DUF6491 family protein [Pseudoxanthomonas indica]GGD57705.1 hypothetical protein GCM10007235_32450 [Pseudoxanthomonas indica]SKC48649.1 hypothetical protein SAMN06296058_0669 [Pseudoxanthomonas indica]